MPLIRSDKPGVDLIRIFVIEFLVLGLVIIGLIAL